MKDQHARGALRAPHTFSAWTIADCARTIPSRFEQQVQKTPHAPAVALVSGDVTYSQLNRAAERAARVIREAVGPDTRPVALLCPQGYESIVWTLGVLKAGLPYAPLDQRLPTSTLHRMVEDLDPAALFAAEAHLALGGALASNRIPILAASDVLRDEGTEGAERTDRQIRRDDTAYIFYTSGSTGVPKGVADSHRNVLHNILRYTNTLRFAPGDRLSLVQNPSFSGTVSTLFGALLNGATVAPFDLQGDGLSSLSAWIRRLRLTVFHAVPSIFRVLSDSADRFPDLRLVRLEGDRTSGLDLAHFRSICQPSCTLVNGLGATECGLVRQYFVDAQSTETGELVPIGYAVPDVDVRVLDEAGRDVDAETSGEIVVESRFLATGYWRNPALTNQRFEDLGEGVRRYHTGDRGRLQPDGCLIHLGRIDHRVRIAGEFVDSAELEGLLTSVAGVQQVVVHDYLDEAEERRLCAYIVRDPSTTVSVESLREFLITRVGQHAVPSAFTFLDQFPLTKDLKVDRRHLPRPGRERPALPNEFVAPRTDQEQQIARIWSEVLEIEPVGVTDSLLALGGDSLHAARIVNRLRPIYGDRLRITSVFEHPTIRALSHALGSAERSHNRDAVASSQNPSEDHRIAIIGMAARLPGANSIDDFWDNLRSARESITFFRDEGRDPTAESGVVCARGLLADVDRFDAPLFNLTPRQAQMLDPQQRVWLECVHHALEDAGIPIVGSHDHTSASIGVFAGGKESTYLWHVLGGRQPSVDALLTGSSEDALELLNGNDRDSIATRTSFVFGLTGPSINVQSACSTSLVAVAQACQALNARLCDVAVAGGVTVTFPQKRGYRHESGGMYSRDGHCRAFDAQASGTTFSDGAGAVILKRLDQAMRDGDRIDAVIRGWAVNNDGANKASFAAPSIEGQVRVITQAQQHAGVGPEDISYVEAHGTGTPIGDPIEFTALERAFRRDGGDRSGFCGLGSVKTNIGHVDAAAGIAGLIKTVLSLKHREIPPTLHFQSPNPEIALQGSPFYVVDQLTPWNVTQRSRIVAGVSSLGVGGTNCHVIVEEGPEEPRHPSVPSVCLVTLSAASPEALHALEERYERFVSDESGPDITRIALTTQMNRVHRRYRTAIRCATPTELREGLAVPEAPAQGNEPSGKYRRWRGRANDDLSIGFLFAGQGSQYPGMGRALYEANTDFRRHLDRCDDLLRGHLDRSLLEVMFEVSDTSLIDRTEYAQPALFAVEYSIAQLLRQWGIQPRIVMGHSIGEYAAACLAGVFSLEEGLALTAERGRLMQRAPGNGRMLAVSAPADTLRELLAPVATEVSIAAVNSPFQTVVSGPADAVGRLENTLREQGVYTRALAVSHAFHSAQMAPSMGPLQDLFARLSLQPARTPVVSNLSGRVASAELTKPAYWSDHARQAVQFSTGVRSLIEEGCEVLVEIGPDTLLSHLVRENDPDRRLTTIATLRRGEQGLAAMLDALGQLYVHGARVDWPAVHGQRSMAPVRLPGYPFQRARHWYQGPLARIESATVARDGGHPLLGVRLRLPGSNEVRFEVRFSQTAPHYLADHRLFGVSLPPGASYFAMLAQAAAAVGGGDTAPSSAFRFESLYLLRPLLLPDGCVRAVQLILRADSQGWEVELASGADGDVELSEQDWTTHLVARGRDLPLKAEPGSALPWDLDAIRASCNQTLSGSEFYSKIWANHGGTGSSFRWIESIWRGDRLALARAVCPTTVTDASSYRLHPGLIEAACQVLHCCGEIETADGLEASGATYVPFSVDTFTLSGARATHDEAWCHARLREMTRENVIADLTILSATGEVVAQLEGFCLRQITREAVTGRTSESVGARMVEPLAGSPERTGSSSMTAEEAGRYLRRKCAELAGYVESEVRLDVGFAALGLDSIAAMRLSNHLLRDLGHTVSLGEILNCRSLVALADRMATQSSHNQNAISDRPPIGR